MEKSYRKYASKASPRPFFILAKNPKQPLNAERRLSKTVKKLNFIFSLEPIAF